MPGRRRNEKFSSPIDAKLQALNERQKKLMEDEEGLRRKLDELPKKAAESKRRRREELISQSGRTRGGVDGTSLFDKRFDVAMSASGRSRRRPLKSEQRQARLIFSGLLLLLLILVAWLLRMWHL